MLNEILLIVSLPAVFASVLIAFRLFGKQGLYIMSVFFTISANIEVTILINAFGFKQTLGNILFAATFLITDILSECYGKKEANKCVSIGIFASVVFILLSQSWLLYAPSDNDFVHGAVRTIFSNTPRLMISSLAVYAICQRLDVFLYHKWWALTERLSNSKREYLWVRNNASTLITQLINTVLFNVAAFVGIYELKTLVSIIFFGYVIYIVTSLLDTPFIYMARRIFESKQNTVK